MACNLRIHRNDNGTINKVEKADGTPSELFNSLRLKYNEEVALRMWATSHTKSFKDWIKNSFGVESTEEPDIVLVEKYLGLDREDVYQLKPEDEMIYSSQLKDSTPKAQKEAVRARLERQREVVFDKDRGKQGKYVLRLGQTNEVEMDRVSEILNQDDYYKFDGPDTFQDNRDWGTMIDIVLGGVILKKDESEIRKEVAEFKASNPEVSAELTPEAIGTAITTFQGLLGQYPDSIFLTQQIEYNEQLKVAGSTDIVIIHPDGTETIMDLKTSLKPTKEEYTIIANNGKEYKNSYDKPFIMYKDGKRVKKASKKERHQAQLSIYKGLAIAQGSRFAEKDLFVVPIHITDKTGSTVERIEAEPIIPITASKLADTYSKDTFSEFEFDVAKANDYQTFVDRIVKVLHNKIKTLEAQGRKKFFVEKILTAIESVERAKAIDVFVNDAYDQYLGSSNFIGLEKATVSLIRKINTGKLSGDDAIKQLLELKEVADLYSAQNNSLINDLIQLYTKEKILQDPEYRTTREPEEGSPLWKLNQVQKAIEFVQSTFLDEAPALVADILSKELSDSANTQANVVLNNLVKRREQYAKTKGENSKVVKTLDKRIKDLKDQINPTKEVLERELSIGGYKDISMIDKMVTPAISQSNNIVSTFAKKVKKTFEVARNKAREFAHDADKQFNEYAKATGLNRNNAEKFNEGIYETIKLGSKKVQAFVTPVDYEAFYEARRTAKESIDKLPPGEQSKAWTKWYNENTQDKVEVKIGNTVLIKSKEDIIAEQRKALVKTKRFYNRVKGIVQEVEDTSDFDYWLKSRDFVKATTMPKQTKYPNDSFSKLKADPAKSKYYEFLISSYFKSQSRLPDKGAEINKFILPSITKSSNDRIRENGLLNYFKYKTSDLAQFKDEDKDHIGNSLKVVPVLYRQSMPAEDVSVDLITSIMRFEEASLKYQAQSSLTNLADTTLDLVKSSTPAETTSKGDKILSTAASLIGADSFLKYKDKHGGNNVAALLEAFIDMQIYGRMKDSVQVNVFGITTVDLAKIADTLISFSSKSMIGGNPLLSVANSLQAEAMLRMEAASGEFFDKKDWRSAQAEYAKLEAKGDFFKDNWSNNINKTKIGQLIDLYDPLQGEFSDKFGNRMSKGATKRITSWDTWFKLQSKGEHHVAVTSMIAMLKREKVTHNGKTISLYDAYTVDPKTGKIRLPEGLTFEGDSIASTDLRNRLHAINKRLHGVYNSFDKAIIERHWYGRLFMMFRKFVAPGFKKRYKSLGYDQELGAITEGTYTTFYRALTTETKELMKMLNPINKEYGDFTEFERANIRRAVFEFGMIAALGAIVMLLSALVEAADDEETKIALSYPLYWAMRLKAELKFYGGIGDIISKDGIGGVFNPLNAVPVVGSFKETFRMFRTPTIGFTLLEKTFRLIDQLGDPLETYKRDTDFYLLGNNIGEKGDYKLPVLALKLLGYTGNTANPRNAIKILELTTN